MDDLIFGIVSSFDLPAVQDFGRRVFEFRIYHSYASTISYIRTEAAVKADDVRTVREYLDNMHQISL